LELNIFIISIILSLILCVKADIPNSSNDSKVTIASKERASLPRCETRSLPPQFRENCTKEGGKVIEAHSMALCHEDKVCQCPYLTCMKGKPNDNTFAITVTPNTNVIPKSSVKTTQNIDTKIAKKRSVVKSTPKIVNKNKSATPTLPPCTTYSLPPNYHENCTKNGGMVTATYSMAVCDNGKTCQCSYTTCTTTISHGESKKSKKNVVNNNTMESTLVTKITQPTPEPVVKEKCAKKWEQCDGKGFTGPICCQSGLTCRKLNKYYSLCMK
jgi:hypothetical protein